MKKYFCLRGLISICLIAALIASVSVFSFADGEKISWAYPQEGDDLSYQWELEKNVSEVDFSDAALYLSFAVQSGGRQHLVRANWLPELSEEEQESELDMSVSFLEHLAANIEYLDYSDIYGREIEKLLEESGLTEGEAGEWYTSIEMQSALTYPYKIEVLDNYQLYGRDLILGAYGAKALSVEEATLGNYEMIKASIDYSPLYEDVELSALQWEELQKSIVKNYIFLFDSEEEYMICISGTSDMAILEKIGENIEVYETGLERNYFDNGLDYIFHDMGRG